MLKKAMQGYQTIVNHAARVANYIGVGTIMLMVLITTADVIMRRVFSAPIIGAHEIQNLSLMVVAFMTWGYCQVLRGHIDITFITDHLPQRMMGYVDIIFNTAALVLYSVLTWRIIMQTIHMKEVGVTTAELRLPEWPFLGIFGVVGVSLFVLVLITTISKTVAELRKN